MNARSLFESCRLDAFGWWRAALTVPALAGFWWLIAAEASSWLVGVPSVLLAAALAGSVRGATGSLRVARLPAFAAWFVWQSMRGGFDVALRALRPDPRVAPGLVRRRTRLPPEARPLFANTITLLPGTLTVRLDGEDIDIHAIDRSAAVDADLDAAERQVAELMTGPSSGASR